MPTWDLAEIQAGLGLKSEHVRNASNDWKGTVQANSNDLASVGKLTATRVIRGTNTVTYSATPTFDASLGDIQKITLTGNVTSSTLSNVTAGQEVVFIIIQDSTPRTFVWPTNVFGGMTLDDASGSVNIQKFICHDGTNLHAISTGLSS